jgi:glutathione S-transferase
MTEQGHAPRTAHPGRAPKQDAMRLQLISHPLCPYVQRAVIALEEKQAPYERTDIDLANKPAWFLALSPLGKTPLLLAEGEPVFESAVICEYLEDTVQPALHPADSLARARHRGWIEFASAVLNGIAALYSAVEEGTFESARLQLRARFESLEQALGEGPYFAGAGFSLVDAAFAPVFRYLDLFDQADMPSMLAGLAKLQAWRRVLAARPSVRKAVRPGYPAALRDFVERRQGVLAARLRLAA